MDRRGPAERRPRGMGPVRRLRSDHGDLQLQRFDFPEEHEDAPVPYPFDSDVDVWVFVRTRAEEGSELHRRALALLAWMNPDEHHRVMQA